MNLQHIAADLFCEDQYKRVIASQDLLKAVRADSRLFADARKLCHRVIDERRDATTVRNAIACIELIDGTAAAWPIRLSMFDDPRANFVKGIVLSITGANYTAPLIELLSRRNEVELRTSIIRILGRLKGPRVFETLVGCLSNATLRAHSVEALADLGDYRAIEHLQPLLNDNTPAWEEDNHGPMLYVRNLAAQAITKLQRHS